LERGQESGRKSTIHYKHSLIWCIIENNATTKLIGVQQCAMELSQLYKLLRNYPFQLVVIELQGFQRIEISNFRGYKTPDAVILHAQAC